jgi:hypothetical protein
MCCGTHRGQATSPEILTPENRSTALISLALDLQILVGKNSLNFPFKFTINNVRWRWRLNSTMSRHMTASAWHVVQKGCRQAHVWGVPVQFKPQGFRCWVVHLSAYMS